MVLKELICPFINCVAFIFKFIWSGGLERNQDLFQFYHVSAILKQIWLVLHRVMTWLPTIGDMLAKTHIYNLKHTPWELMVGGDPFLVCPWSFAWSLTLLSCVLDLLYAWRSWCSCSYPPWQWFSCEHEWIPGFSSSHSLWPVLFFLPWEDQVHHCHHVLVYK